MQKKGFIVGGVVIKTWIARGLTYSTDTNVFLLHKNIFGLQFMKCARQKDWIIIDMDIHNMLWIICSHEIIQTWNMVSFFILWQPLFI